MYVDPTQGASHLLHVLVCQDQAWKPRIRGVVPRGADTIAPVVGAFPLLGVGGRSGQRWGWIYRGVCGDIHVRPMERRRHVFHGIDGSIELSANKGSLRE